MIRIRISDWLRTVAAVVLGKARGTGRDDPTTRLARDADFGPIRKRDGSPVPYNAEPKINAIEELERIISAHEPAPEDVPRPIHRQAGAPGSIGNARRRRRPGGRH